MDLVIRFLGAARTVTGSRFLLEAGEHRLLFDCGLFQGLKELRQRNWNDLPVPAASLDAVILTHAHVDHSAYLPRLVRQGFRGPVHVTPATADLLRIMLPDAAHLQEEEARYANKVGSSKHHPALPLFDAGDAEAALRLLDVVPHGELHRLAGGTDMVFHPSGHILGAAFVEVNAGGRRIVFSGDLGGYGDPVMVDPAPLPPGVDYILVESTYGGRVEEHRPIADQLVQHLKPVLDSGNVVVIPAFAVGRTTIVLYHLRQLMDAGRLPDVPVFVDSPMATDAVELYCRHGGEHNLRVDLLRDTTSCPIRPHRVKLIRSVEESKELNDLDEAAIIVSASGMATGGRVIHHLRRRLPDPHALILLVGWQADGTRGRRLVNGEPEVRIFGRMVPVKARVAEIRGLSAHGDEDEVLRWLKTARNRPKKAFLVHGEDDALRAMRERVERELKWDCHVPQWLEKVELQ